MLVGAQLPWASPPVVGRRGHRRCASVFGACFGFADFACPLALADLAGGAAGFADVNSLASPDSGDFCAAGFEAGLGAGFAGASRAAVL